MKNDNKFYLEIIKAYQNLKDIVYHSQLQFNSRLSEKFNAKIYFKREDQQQVRSYKIKGAYNAIFSLDDAQRATGVVCASAETTLRDLLIAAVL